ncbi:MAG TPA: hypothetical protein VMV04_18855, partial [Thermodesulfobacteriota bacterium]|nr:hypothetical protein [Thermodesulfobacteriota bacterium]
MANPYIPLLRECQPFDTPGRDFAFRCWKGDENSDEAEVLSGYQGRKGVKSYDGAFSWWPFEVGI